MKIKPSPVVLTSIAIITLLSACGAPAASEPGSTLAPEITNGAINTIEPVVTDPPTATPLPGLETLPLDGFATNLPWLPLDKTARPGAIYYLFNLTKPPFSNVLVRQAFAAAVDRGALTQLAIENGMLNPSPATSFTHPKTLGRDLFNEVGILFHPANARALLAQAGYTDLTKFPAVTLLTLRGENEIFVRMAEEIAEMWKINLGITVTIEVVKTDYWNRIQTDPSEVFLALWSADYNDPDNFLGLFRTGSPYNYNFYSNAAFDELIDTAAVSTNPAERQALYIQAERLLCETDVALIPISHVEYNIP